MTPPSTPGHQQVLQPDVGERAAHHHLVVAAAGAVGVEVLRLHAELDQVAAGRAVGLDRAGGRDVVGGDGVAEQRQHARAVDVVQRRRLARHAVEERRRLDVGRRRVPGVAVAGRHRHPAPLRVALEHVRVLGAVALRRDGAQRLVHLGRRRPDVAEEDRLALRVGADGIALGVEVHGARQRVGDDQRRRRQVVGARQRVHAALEVAVARQHRRDHQVARLDGLRHRLGQRSGVADAGGAAVAHQVEAERGEVVEHAGVLQVARHHLRARREAGLHPRLHAQAARRRLAGDDAGAQHHRRVRRVGAARDGGDHHGAVLQLAALARPSRPAAIAAASPGFAFR